MMHHNTKDLTGKRFGRLIVVNLSEKRGNRNQLKWLCQCDCGTQKVIEASLLRSGKTKSCGCLLKETRYAKSEKTDRTIALFKLLYSPLKKRHKSRFDIKGIITFEEFIRISTMNCFYCGSPPISKIEDVRHEAKYKKMGRIIITDTTLEYNGIDRIDSSKGYEKNNVHPCCRHCNTAKNALSTEEFRNLIKRIYTHWAAVQ